MAKHKSPQSPTVWTTLIRTLSAVQTAIVSVQNLVGFAGIMVAVIEFVVQVVS